MLMKSSVFFFFFLSFAACAFGVISKNQSKSYGVGSYGVGALHICMIEGTHQSVVKNWGH